ncbi:MAG: 16S rRNA (adenine(1518)-N(6)/adenine(1519)-N(6))-dimethyltransferase RsmA [Sphingobacteriales bacterium]|jgi:16S rRNA (adenine1518-N6/adenine1519-N6)-dimethyltransferase|nr:16S rRNA (adenine(1518)-N(6)/adenine(1519)-N(6))-dimethyltransferase RsmA [Sphingobacteriales bacterium]
MNSRSPVRAKKHLGQHFLRDERIAEDIADALLLEDDVSHVLELGPGTGVLTKYMLARPGIELWAIEVDDESVAHLKTHYPELVPNLINADFLRTDLTNIIPAPFALIGNFPYNISTQILFRVLELRDRIPVVVGMFQKEVAERIASGPGNRDYGILSVLLQPWYDIEYLFTVPEHVFEPPPRVKSGVLRMKRNARVHLECNEVDFKRVVKQGFSQRRKTLRNALKPMLPADYRAVPYLDLRAEALTWQQFVELTLVLVPQSRL